MWKQNQRKFPHSLAIHYLRFASVLSRSLPTPIKAGRFPFAQNLQNSVVHWIVRRGNFLWFCYFSCVNGRNSSRTHVRLGAWFWSAKADIFFSESLHIYTSFRSAQNHCLPDNVRPRGAFISVGDCTPTEKDLLLLTTCRSGSLLDWDKQSFFRILSVITGKIIFLYFLSFIL